MTNANSSKRSTDLPKKKTFQSILEGPGKLPPQAIDFEEAVLGALILEADSLSKVMFLKPEMFYREAHQKIFKAILELRKGNHPIDLLTVAQRLKFNGELELVGGPYHITELTSRIASSANIQYHARIIYQMWLGREIIRLSSEHIRDAFEDTTDIFDLIKKIDEDFKTINKTSNERKLKSSKDITDQVHINTVKGNLVLKTGWKKFDENISLEHNTLILWTGSRKDGKTKILTQMMKRILRKYSDEIIVVWAALEDKGLGTFYNFISSDLLLQPKMIRNGFIAGKEAEYQKAKEEFENFPIHFIEGNETSKEIKDIFIQIARDNPTKLPILIVDNVLSLGDKEEFKKDPNAMYDYIGNQLMEAKNVTNGQVHIVHHYKDSQMDPKRVEEGFRPAMTDPKGTEVWGRICTGLILMNNPHLRKELYKQYSGKDKDLLKHLFIMDIGANRDDNNDDESKSVIRFLHSNDFSIYEEL